MKRIVTAKLLSIAAGPSSLLIAELSSQKGEPRLLRTLELKYTAEASLEKPLALGKALHHQMRGANMAARDAIIALPVRWLVTRRKELPPLSAEMAASTLRLYAEGEFGAEYREMVVDFAGAPANGAPSVALLVGTRLALVEQCRQLAQAAGLRLLGITSLGGAMASVVAAATGEKTPLLSLSALGSELVLQQQGVPTHLRHLSAGTSPDGAALAAELRRTLAGLPPLPPEAPLAVTGGSCREDAEFARRLGMPITELTPDRLLPGAADDAAPFAPALAAGVAALRDSSSLVDFLDSRLAPPQEAQNRRPLIWAAALVAALLIAAAAAMLDLRQQRAQIADLRARLDAMAPDIKVAEAAVNRLEAARNSSGGNPCFVPCLAQLTQLFPDDGSIWLANLTLRQNMAGQISGKASGEQQILSLLDRMNACKRLAEVKLLDMREAGRGAREVTFSISFTYSAGAPKS